MNIDDIARICHEVNKAYCHALDDHSQPSWEHAPEWQKLSAVNGVRLHVDNPHAGPEASHESWIAEKVAAGWVRGDVKDPEKKTHPCIVPFNELPREQQAKDCIFRAVVHACSRHIRENLEANLWTNIEANIWENLEANIWENLETNL